MADDLFLDLWQPQHKGSRAGPLLPSTHAIKDAKKLYFIKQQVSQLWNLKGVRQYNPAPNPVSIERRDLVQLHQQQYLVAEKTDGVRYLLLLTQYPKFLGGQPCAVMINRKSDAYEIRVMAEEDYFNGSLFDGELVWDYEGGQYTPPRQTYLIFDVVACRGVCYVKQNLVKRFSLISEVFDIGDKDISQDPRKWIEQAHELAKSHKVVCEGNQYCLTFKPKSMLPAHMLDVVWRNKQSLHHKSDGLIFTPVDLPIQTGTHPAMFKWKSHHTIDVLWMANWNAKEKVWDHELCYDQGDRVLKGTVEGIVIKKPPDILTTSGSTAAEEEEVYPYHEVPLIFIPNTYANKVMHWYYQRGQLSFQHIVECSCKMPSMTEWLSENDIPMVECSLLKIRYDKVRPNQKNTIEKTLRNIQELITIKDLLDTVHTK